jgi:hypothetical protein
MNIFFTSSLYDLNGYTDDFNAFNQLLVKFDRLNTAIGHIKRKKQNI